MLDEPVRGGFPDPQFFSLPGIDQLRAFLRNMVLPTPISHLVGLRLTQVGSGTTVVSMPLSPWLQLGDGTVDFRLAAELAAYSAVLSTAPGGHEIITSTLAVHHLRPCTLSSEGVNARGRVLNTSRTFTVVEVLVEDAHGRALAHMTGSALVRPMQPPPPGPPPQLQPVRAPTYATPDPYLRPLPPDIIPDVADVDEQGGWRTILAQLVAGKIAPPPASDLLGVRPVDPSEGASTWVLRPSEWHCVLDRRQIQAGYIFTVAHYAMSTAAGTLCSPGLQVGVVEQTLSFLGSVRPDGREVVARGKVVHRSDFVVATVQVTDAEGTEVALGHGTGLLVERGAAQRVEPERILATVVFTDLVGSTQRAEQLGDDRWRRLLEEHNNVVRRQLLVFKGREVKSVGDGFLATFESPARAIQCARSIRDGVKQLGLEVRTGIHTGECEVMGADIAGIAVHIASRVLTVAGPGEILVSSTVRELVTGSGLQFTDQGRHTLKGIEGGWQLFAVAG